MKIKNYFLFAVLAVFATGFVTSCSENDLLDGVDDPARGDSTKDGLTDLSTTTFVLDFDGYGTDYSYPAGSDPYGVNEYGDNFYSTYSTPFIYYTDPESQLRFGINEGTATWTNPPYTSYEYYYGGIGLSRYNDLSDVTYTNQLSVYAGVNGIPGPGYGGSEGFAVVFGYSDQSNNIEAPYVIFADNKPADFVSMQVCNTVYTRDVILNGNKIENGQANSLPNTKGWFYIDITGYRLSGAPVTSRYYLADYGNQSGELNGIREGWNEVDLSAFTNVYKLEFSMGGSDNDPIYGLNTPAYFAMDNLTFKK
ncbi:MAG: DUF4465 domain-containing protein [Tannerellaceae bacterium]|nr:DUF4465 domain-containing protein [Tannerellaceae bacterium]